MNLADSTLEDINLTGTTIKNVNLSTVAIDDADFTGMKLDGILVMDLMQVYLEQKGA